MKTVYKYPIDPAKGGRANTLDGNVVLLARDEKLQMICAWVEVDPSDDQNTQTLQIFGTGHSIPGHAQHEASCVDGPFVCHLYRV